MKALSAENLDLFFRLSAAGLGVTDVGDAASSNSDGLTPHEKVLDWCRVAITGLLVLALFVIIFHVSTTKSATATPYISLLSGLAGIALGWMFTNMGSPTGTKPSPRERAQNRRKAKGTS